MDFDSSMSKVQALSGSTGEELIKLKRKAQELGASTAWSASQVSEAMQYMALAGWDANQMLEGLQGFYQQQVRQVKIWQLYVILSLMD